MTSKDTKVARNMDAIIRDLQQAQERVLKSARTTLEEAKRCGEILLEAKEQVDHGEWATWLDRHFDGDERVARNYMRIAQNWEQLTGGKSELNSVLSVSEAVKKLASPKKNESTSSGSQQQQASGGQQAKEPDPQPQQSTQSTAQSEPSGGDDGGEPASQTSQGDSGGGEQSSEKGKKPKNGSEVFGPARRKEAYHTLTKFIRIASESPDYHKKVEPYTDALMEWAKGNA